MTSPLINLKLAVKGLNKRVLEQSSDGPLEEYRRVLNEKVNVISNNRGFRTHKYSVAIYEQIKEGLSYFYVNEKSRLMEVTLNRSIFMIFNLFSYYNVVYLFIFKHSN